MKKNETMWSHHPHTHTHTLEKLKKNVCVCLNANHLKAHVFFTDKMENGEREKKKKFKSPLYIDISE